VLEYGRILSDSLPLERAYDTYRVKHFSNNGPLFYAEYNIRLFFYLLFHKTGLIFANDLDTLPAAFLISKIKGVKLIYDTHEYFTETPELTNRPFVQKIWKSIENFIFPKLNTIITVNQSIAELYSNRFGKHIDVVRNIPISFTPSKIKSRIELRLPENKKIILIQGTGINKDRGAEEACQMMEYLDDFVLLIIGSGDVIPDLKEIIKRKHLEHKIIIINKLPFKELRQYTMNADLGLAIDKNTNSNYYYSLPNKLFDYIHAEIPVLSTKLIEINKIIDQYNIGYYIENHNPEHMANVVRHIFADQETYTDKMKNCSIAKEKLCWEIEEEVLLGSIRTTMEKC
jgi:glycosyltransferase involved in cell wall biosynthesis